MESVFLCFRDIENTADIVMDVWESLVHLYRINFISSVRRIVVREVNL